MASFLSLILFLLMGIPNDTNAQACYCTTPYTPNSTFGSSCTANADCWACAPGAYSPSWQQAFCGNYQAPAPSCTQVTDTQILSCPANYTGTITQTRIKTCPDNQWQAWQTTQNSCVANPPTCQIGSQTKTEACPTNYSGAKTYTKTSTCPDPYGQPLWGDWLLSSNTCAPNPPTCRTSTESQTLSCQTGYTGSITQTRFSTCPDPYGQPLWGAWTTTTSTCTKSISNPTNPTSPVSPISPTATVTAPAVITPSVTTSMPTQSPAEVPGVPSAQTVESAPTTSATSDAPKTESSATPPSAGTSAGSGSKQEIKKDKKDEKETSKSGSKSQGSGLSPRKNSLSIGGFGLALSLELFVKPGIQNPDLLPKQVLPVELTNEFRQRQEILGDILIEASSSNDDYLRWSSRTGWDRIYKHNEIQRSGFGD